MIQARNQDFSKGGGTKRATDEFFFYKNNSWFVFTVVYGFLYDVVNVRYED